MLGRNICTRRFDRKNKGEPMPQEQRPTEKFRTSVGGQALMEGIMMRGPKNICCAVRKPDGTIETLSLIHI